MCNNHKFFFTLIYKQRFLNLHVAMYDTENNNNNNNRFLTVPTGAA